MRRFFEDYKVLEEKHVSIEHLQGPREAVAVIDEALRAYEALRSTKT